MRVLYVNPMEYEANPGADAIGFGMQHRLDQIGIEMRVIIADFRAADWEEATTSAIEAGIEAGVDAIVTYVLDPLRPAAAVETARAKGIPVFTLERPQYPVDGSLVYANFNHGVYMAEHLASMLRPGARVGVIGGPEIVDDVELVVGIVHGVRSSGLTLVNDPFEERYRNTTDVSSGGQEAALRLLEDFSHLDGLVPFNDETMLGTLEALREVNRLGEMKMVSRNGTPKAVQAILDGHTHGTWDLDCPGIGAAVADLVARRLVEGEQFEGELALAPIGRMVTTATAPGWVPWSKRIPYTPPRMGLD